MKKAQVSILPGLTTEIWGYNGIAPGPTIKQRQGRKSVVRFIINNGVNMPTSVSISTDGLSYSYKLYYDYH